MEYWAEAFTRLIILTHHHHHHCCCNCHHCCYNHHHHKSSYHLNLFRWCESISSWWKGGDVQPPLRSHENREASLQLRVLCAMCDMLCGICNIMHPHHWDQTKIGTLISKCTSHSVMYINLPNAVFQSYCKTVDIVEQNQCIVIESPFSVYFPILHPLHCTCPNTLHFVLLYFCTFALGPTLHLYYFPLHCTCPSL